MKLKKVIAAATVASMAIALVACNKTAETGVSVDDSDVIVLTSEDSIVDEDVTGDGETVDGEEEYVDEKAFIGTWVCGRASMEITPDANGYDVEISWANSAAEVCEWSYFCLFDGEKLMNHADGVNKDVTYAEDGSSTEVVNYEDGAVTFELNEDNMILWNDEKENAGDGMAFEKVEIVDVE